MSCERCSGLILCPASANGKFESIGDYLRKRIDVAALPNLWSYLVP